ncbi:uncharacterized protein LOC126690110 isoform X2 [Quercus robur]|uniref:uncharacterized protein LOC115990632 isoform X2 n=1 Tax=Quercus lobata TaxID=97700 RepID=UPI001245B6CE|nr:uncharacterized protein LOC115990632 isoform X2 [Quercus lobata]XP_050241204.1 uncharacterized protein LOC126690110 isoform X2 [Quercus robur]
MALVNNQPKKESPGIGIRKSKSLLLSGTSLASVESLSMPLVQEVVISADIRCSECQKRVADMMSRMNESVVVNLLEKKVTLTCRYANVGKASSQQVAAIYRNPFGKVAMIKRIFRSSRR